MFFVRSLWDGVWPFLIYAFHLSGVGGLTEHRSKNMQSGAPIGLRMEAGLWKTRSLSAIGALICLSPNHQVFSAILQCFNIFHHVSPPVHTWFNHQRVEPKLLTGPAPRTTPRSELTKSEFDVQYGVAWIQNMQHMQMALAMRSPSNRGCVAIFFGITTEAWRKALVEGPPQRRVEPRSAPRVLALNEHVR